MCRLLITALNSLYKLSDEGSLFEFKKRERQKETKGQPKMMMDSKQPKEFSQTLTAKQATKSSNWNEYT